MNTNGMLQASEEERLKMLNCCCMPSDNLIADTGNTLLLLALIKRIEQLEETLTKNGIDIPEWKELLNGNG